MSGTTLLLILAALLAVPAGLALTRAPSARREEEWSGDAVVVDLEFLRARPAELDQRISEIAALSGRATLGARMRTVQLPAESPAPRPVRVRRRARPLVASR